MGTGGVCRKGSDGTCATHEVEQSEAPKVEIVESPRAQYSKFGVDSSSRLRGSDISLKFVIKMILIERCHSETEIKVFSTHGLQ